MLTWWASDVRLPEPAGAETDYDGVEPWLPLVQVHRLQFGECLDLEIVSGDHAL